MAFSAWYSSFLPVFGQKKSREPFKDFLLGGAAGGRHVFNFLVFYQSDKLEVVLL